MAWSVTFLDVVPGCLNPPLVPILIEGCRQNRRIDGDYQGKLLQGALL